MKKNEWFKCYPDKWLGAFAAMKPHEGYIYFVICLRIYECNGPCHDTAEALALRTTMNLRWVKDAISRLKQSGKLIERDGGLINPFAETVLHERKSRGHHAMPSQGITECPPEKHQQKQGTLLTERREERIEESDRKKDRRESARRRAPRAMIKTDWQPSEKDMQHASKLGFDEAHIAQMARAFVNYHRSRGTLIADLAATWRTWCDNELKFQRKSPRSNGQASFVDIALGRL